MEIRPIKTEAEYQAALAEIGRLFDAEPGSREAHLLEVWTTLVEAYKEKQLSPLPEVPRMIGTWIRPAASAGAFESAIGFDRPAIVSYPVNPGKRGPMKAMLLGKRRAV